MTQMFTAITDCYSVKSEKRKKKKEKEKRKESKRNRKEGETQLWKEIVTTEYFTVDPGHGTFNCCVKSLVNSQPFDFFEKNDLHVDHLH